MTTSLDRQLQTALRHTLGDVRVELLQQFIRNFTRQGFFNDRWKRKRRDNGKPILIGTGTLRRSIGAKVKGNAVTFYSTEDYALIHQNGGTIKVTPRMKRYFWARYYQATNRMTTRKDGTYSRTKRNRQLSEDAQFYRAMALKRVGSPIRIPARKFIGMHPEVEKNIREIVERNFREIMSEVEFDFNH